MPGSPTFKRNNTFERDDGESQENKGLINQGPVKCTGGFACQCPVCDKVIKEERRAAVVEAQVHHINENAERAAQIIEDMYEGKSMEFQWLMTSLLPISEKY